MCYLLAAITLTARWRRGRDKRMRRCGCSSLCCRIQTWPRRDWQRHDIGGKQKAPRRIRREMSGEWGFEKINSKSQLLAGGRRRSSFKLDYSCAAASACVSLRHVGSIRLKTTQKFSEGAFTPALCSPDQTKTWSGCSVGGFWCRLNKRTQRGGLGPVSVNSAVVYFWWDSHKHRKSNTNLQGLQYICSTEQNSLILSNIEQWSEWISASASQSSFGIKI